MNSSMARAAATTIRRGEVSIFVSAIQLPHTLKSCRKENYYLVLFCRHASLTLCRFGACWWRCCSIACCLQWCPRARFYVRGICCNILRQSRAVWVHTDFTLHEYRREKAHFFASFSMQRLYFLPSHACRRPASTIEVRWITTLTFFVIKSGRSFFSSSSHDDTWLAQTTKLNLLLIVPIAWGEVCH